MNKDMDTTQLVNLLNLRDHLSSGRRAVFSNTEIRRRKARVLE